MIQDGLTRLLVSRNMGRNGWAVIVTLCKALYADGRLGRIGAKEIGNVTGLNPNQVARGMAELRDKGIIVHGVGGVVWVVGDLRHIYLDDGIAVPRGRFAVEQARYGEAFG